MIAKRISTPIPYWRFFKMKADKDLDASIKVIEEVINEYIEKAKNRIADVKDLSFHRPNDFIEALLLEEENSNSKFSDEEVYGNVFTILIAGEDTTSNTLSWVLYYLAQKTDLVAKLKEEA